MSAKHTPGPWSVGDADWSERGNARYELEGIKEICAPDARLIAAAPELLEALQHLYAHTARNGTGAKGWNAALNKAENALAKAGC